MKLKVVVLDLELTPRFQKWAVRIGAVAALVLGGGAIAWAAGLHTWNQDDVLNATDLNGNFTTLQGQITTLQGQTNGAITAGAYIVDNAGGASIGYQSGGSWIQSVNRTATGSVTITIAPSYFSTNPPCSVTPNSVASFATLPVVTTTQILVNLLSPGGSAVDSNFMIVCVQQHG